MPTPELDEMPGGDADAARMARVASAACPQAFAELTAAWRPRIERLCFRLCGNMADAEDLTQEIFHKLFRSRERYRIEAKFSTFLWQIATNHCRDFSRSQRRRAVSAEQHRGRSEFRASEADNNAERELRVAVQEALWRLPESFRTVLVLRHYENLKFSEIAELLEIPRGTVASRMAKALRLLERDLIRKQSFPAVRRVRESKDQP